MSTHRVLSTKEILRRPSPHWLVDFVLPEHGLGTLWGASNVGKSFYALDLACSVATGNSWLGRDVRQADAIYVAGEGAGGFNHRVRAWLEWNNADPDDLDRLHWIDWPIQLHQGVQSFIRLVKDIEPGLIIIDTLSASSLGVVEDSADGMAPVIASLLELRKTLKTAVVAVHHTGWSRDHERGSTILRGAMEASIEVRGEKGWDDDDGYRKMRRKLICHKQRDGRKFAPIHTRLRPVSWPGRNRVIESLVPVIV